MNEAKVGQLLTGLKEEGFNFKSVAMPVTNMSEINALLQCNYSQTMQGLETPATNSTILSFNRG